eukprot:gene23960-9532_t
MYSTPSKGSFAGLALTGRDPNATLLSPCPPSALKSAANLGMARLGLTGRDTNTALLSPCPPSALKSAAKGAFAGLALTGRDPNTTLLSPCPPSALKSAARRLEVYPPSAMKEGAISFSRAIDHFSLMERVTALETERESLKQDLRESKTSVLSLTKQLEERPLPKQPDAEQEIEEGANADPHSMSREELVGQVTQLREALVKEQQARRAAHNALVDLKGNVRVYCRMRPSSGGEAAVTTNAEQSSLSVSCNEQQHHFSFNNVFGPSASQQSVFQSVSELVQSSLDGYHVCLFSYGQTGSGKTHNMTGLQSAEGRGIIPRAVDKQGWTYKIEACCLEIYNNKILDLIPPAGGGGSAAAIDSAASGGGRQGGREIFDMNAIKHNADGGSHTHVVGVSRTEISSTEQTMALLQQAASNRASNATAMNTNSSRSHSVFFLNISGRHEENNATLSGALYLVDLAGSERLDRSKAEGQRATEACAINQSLSSLGDVFEALSSRSKHVPYRNSKLTYLLKPCLSPGGKVLMFVHVAPEPESSFETLTSLRFARKVSGTELKVTGAELKVSGTQVGPAQHNVTINGYQQQQAPPTPAPRLEHKTSPPPYSPRTLKVSGTEVGPAQRNVSINGYQQQQAPPPPSAPSAALDFPPSDPPPSFRPTGPGLNQFEAMLAKSTSRATNLPPPMVPAAALATSSQGNPHTADVRVGEPALLTRQGSDLLKSNPKQLRFDSLEEGDEEEEEEDGDEGEENMGANKASTVPSERLSLPGSGTLP